MTGFGDDIARAMSAQREAELRRQDETSGRHGDVRVAIARADGAMQSLLDDAATELRRHRVPTEEVLRCRRSLLPGGAPGRPQPIGVDVWILVRGQGTERSEALGLTDEPAPGLVGVRRHPAPLWPGEDLVHRSVTHPEFERPAPIRWPIVPGRPTRGASSCDLSGVPHIQTSPGTEEDLPRWQDLREWLVSSIARIVLDLERRR